MIPNEIICGKVLLMSTDQLQLDTPRLLLRPPRIEDFGPWAALLQDAEASHFIGGPQPRALAWRGLMVMAGAWHLQGFAMF